MRFVLAFYGTRGDVEPGVAVGRELARRGHDVRMAVPPDLIGFAESAGLAAVAYGPDNQEWLEVTRNFWTRFFRNFWKIQELKKLLRESREPGTQCWSEMSTTLTSLADGADLLLTGMSYQELAVNVAEYRDIPLATLLWFPIRVNGHVVPILPAPLIRSAMTVYEWLVWRGVKKVEDTQRRELGLPKATGPAPRRIAERGSLEIQAYDEVCFPGSGGRMGEMGWPAALRRHADDGVADGCRRGGRVMDCRGNTADFLRVRQHTGRISGRYARHDRQGLCAIGRAGVGWRGLE